MKKGIITTESYSKSRKVERTITDLPSIEENEDQEDFSPQIGSGGNSYKNPAFNGTGRVSIREIDSSEETSPN